MESPKKSLEERYVEILADIDTAYLERTADESGRLSSPFLVSGPRDPGARRIMVIGREFGGRGWRVPYQGGGPQTYVDTALAKHRKFFAEKMEKPARPGTFFHFMKRLAFKTGQRGLIYSNLFCFDSMGRDPRRSSHFPVVKKVSKLLLDAQIEHFQPDAIVFANGMDSVGIRRDFFPIAGEDKVCQGRRDWEHEGIPKGHLWEFELHETYRCYRIHHPSAQSSMAARVRRRLFEIITESPAPVLSPYSQ
ncbi:hypothetical protein GCM10028796_04840 [Ramlibacter monticola]|uniref:Uracil-DNA glycosylase n=1 Tax=Ramlibacter monticola TaxID=1926872 RepID=A0A936YXD1_9BURK|nr:hypothetical protein [Ramlibacter monticola]MBL0391235.1 hypothetical protein [Ramlibacter monticola]